MAVVAKLNAMLDVELPSKTRFADVDNDKLNVNATDAVTLNTALAVVETRRNSHRYVCALKRR